MIQNNGGKRQLESAKTKNKKLIAGQNYKKTNREVKKGKREIIDRIAYEAEKAVKMNDIKSAVREKSQPK